MQRILISGGAGFVGSHLSRRFLSEGCQVWCVDNLLSGSLDNIADLMEEPGFHFVEHDVTRAMPFAGPLDAILHLASPASPVDYQRYPLETLLAGSEGTRVLLELALDKGARFLLASTSEVYGDPEIHPQPESYWGNVNPNGIRSCYDEAKRFAEATTMAYHRTHGVETRIVRLFNTYGPGMRTFDGRVVPTFLSQAIQGKPITVFGDGRQTRSFCYVSDTVDGILGVLRSDHPYPVNIGNPAEYNMLALAEMIQRLFSADVTVVKQDLPEDDPKVRCPDISQAKALFDFSPRISLEDGLRPTYDHLVKVLTP